MDYIQACNYCLEQIRKYLKIYIEKVLYAQYGSNYQDYLMNGSKDNSTAIMMSNDSLSPITSNLPQYQDALFYLNSFQRNWNVISSQLLTKNALNLSYSLRNYRNRIAHQSPLSLRQIYRFIDDTEAFLEEINVNSNELEQLEIIRKNLIIQMSQCNDNVIVMSKKEYNSFNDLNCEMKSIEPSQYDITSSDPQCEIEKKIENNYEKIISNDNDGNFFTYSFYNGE